MSVRLSKQAKKWSVLDSGSEPGTSKAAVAVLPHDLHSDYLLRVDVTDSGEGQEWVCQHGCLHFIMYASRGSRLHYVCFSSSRTA